MPRENTKDVITAFTGTGLVRVVNDSGGSPTSRNMSPANVVTQAGGAVYVFYDAGWPSRPSVTGVVIWVNETDATAPTEDEATDLVYLNDGSAGASSLDELSDVVITSPVTGHILRHNGTNFVNVLGTTHFVAAGSKPSDLAADVATTQSGTSYQIDADDDMTTVVCSNASLVTVTIPTDATDDLRDGYRVMLFASGAAGLTLSTTGITLLGSSPNKTIAQNEGIYLEKTASANTWLLVGGTAA